MRVNFRALSDNFNLHTVHEYVFLVSWKALCHGTENKIPFSFEWCHGWFCCQKLISKALYLNMLVKVYSISVSSMQPGFAFLSINWQTSSVSKVKDLVYRMSVKEHISRARKRFASVTLVNKEWIRCPISSWLFRWKELQLKQ